MPIIRQPLFEGSEIERLILINPASGNQVNVIPYFGGSTEALLLKNPKSGQIFNVLYCPTPEEYLQKSMPASMKEQWIQDFTGPYVGTQLAPWVNRVDHGRYTFNGKEFCLVVNEIPRDNALHGYLFKNGISIKATSDTDSSVSVTLCHSFNAVNSPACPGYPFQVTVEITYTVSHDGFTVTTTGSVFSETHEAPFSCGWHPYFSLDGGALNWRINLAGGKDAVVNDRMIPTGVRDFSGYNGTSVQTLELDNCFQPQVDTQRISTVLTRSGSDAVTVELWQDRDAFPFVQIYTPPHKRSIAIEPVSANINDFNAPQPKKITADQPFSGSYGISLLN
eukprot:TRINITY_DN7681_c0_g1_i1.p1 TRINITY_DN7681_c0_g1~~TRINITY_DN7681_c0_g1_i1.p1  ORF type:complete len:336 (-),score=33.64 TRINITY_DN7681_c0_g1_i1:211-1218(-)